MVSSFTASSRDLWELYDEGLYLVDPTNLTLDAQGRNVMGAGISLAVARRYPAVPAELGRRIVVETANDRMTRTASIALRPSDCTGPVTLIDHERRLVFLPTKYDWRWPSDLALIERALRELAAILETRSAMRVALPQIGAGRGGRDWLTEVLPIVERVLAPVSVQVTLLNPPR